MAVLTDPGELSSPTWLPVCLAGGAVKGAWLDEAAYRDASFLDARVLDGRPTTQAPWADLQAAAPKVRPTHFIFHVGHCGSTLLSRLLGEHPALFVLREPALLRDLAQGELPPAVLDTLLGLYGRVWREDQTALIKTTSFVSDIAPELMARTGGRALLLGVTPPAYLRGVLAGPNSRREIAALAPRRQRRLERRLGRPIAIKTEGEAIALSWLCEAASLHVVANTHPHACVAMDFDAFLATPARGLVAALDHLGVEPGALDVEALLSGPLMRRYAKAPDHPYDSGLRAALLAQADREERAQVRAGMDWLQREARADPRVAEVLTAAASRARGPLAANARPG